MSNPDRFTQLPIKEIQLTTALTDFKGPTIFINYRQISVIANIEHAGGIQLYDDFRVQTSQYPPYLQSEVENAGGWFVVSAGATRLLVVILERFA